MLHEITFSIAGLEEDHRNPEIGYFIAILFSAFYLSRLVGSFTAIAFANGKRSIFIGYMFFFLMSGSTIFHALKPNAYFVVFLRILVGFGAGVAPLTCYMRVELMKIQRLRVLSGDIK